MSTATYTVKLVDIGVHVLGDWMPRLTIRPEIEATRPGVLVASKRMPVVVSGSDGSISVTLIPSNELVGADGRVGVKYLIDVAFFDEAWDGRSRLVEHNQWKFTAAPGGGDIATMGDGPSLALYVGPPWPSSPLPGTYFEPASGDLGYYEIEVH